jgi:hypothetical protein
VHQVWSRNGRIRGGLLTLKGVASICSGVKLHSPVALRAEQDGSAGYEPAHSNMPLHYCEMAVGIPLVMQKQRHE